jgi:hypothetical protein
VKPTRGSSRSPTGGARHRDDEFMWRQVRVADAKLDVLIARRYLAADEREDAEAIQAALEAFLADRLIRRLPPLGLAGKTQTRRAAGRPKRDALGMSPSGLAQGRLS